MRASTCVPSVVIAYSSLLGSSLGNCKSPYIYFVGVTEVEIDGYLLELGLFSSEDGESVEQGGGYKGMR